VVVVVVVVVGLIDGSQEDYVGFKCSRRKTFNSWTSKNYEKDEG